VRAAERWLQTDWRGTRCSYLSVPLTIIVPEAISRSQTHSQVPESISRSQRQYPGPRGNIKVPESGPRSQRQYQGPRGRTKVPEALSRSQTQYQGPRGNIKIPEAGSRSQMQYQGPRGRTKVPEAGSRSQTQYQGPRGIIKVPKSAPRSQHRQSPRIRSGMTREKRAMTRRPLSRSLHSLHRPRSATSLVCVCVRPILCSTPPRGRASSLVLGRSSIVS